MQTDAPELRLDERIWAWYLEHTKETAVAGIVIVVVGLGIGFFIYEQNARQTTAGQALSQAFFESQAAGPRGASAAPAMFLRVANDHSGTPAAGYARLLAAGQLYVAGNYPEAQKQFEDCISDPDPRLAEEAMLGVATCLESLGQTNEAMNAYKRLADRQTDVPTLQAKFALGRMYEAQGKLDQARALYDDVGRSGGQSSLAEEAGMRMHEILRAHPELTPGAGSPTNRPAGTLNGPPS